MAGSTMDDFLADNHDAIMVAVQARMRGNEPMVRIAAQRELGESDLMSQVLGFWLQGIRSDLTLGSTASIEQNLRWLNGFRAGHELPFDDAMVLLMFDDISDEIEARLGADELREEYVAYRVKVEKLISDAFPG